MPLYYLLWGTFFDATGFTFSGFERAYGDDQIFELVGNSLWFAVGAAVLSLVVGTALAYLNVRTDVPFKALFFAASIIPLIIPGILYTIAWIFLASPDIGLLNQLPGAGLRAGAVIDVFTHLGDDLGRGAAPVADRLPAHGGGVPRRWTPRWRSRR